MANKFRINNREERKQQAFEKEKIHIIKAGKKINIYEMIQEGREDTEIYPTLEKYGSIERMKLNSEKTFEDLRNIKDLRNSIDQIKAADEVWKNLPLETRKEFGHSKREFIEKGENWLKNKIETNKKLENKTEITKPIQQNDKTDMKPAE